MNNIDSPAEPECNERRTIQSTYYCITIAINRHRYVNYQKWSSYSSDEQKLILVKELNKYIKLANLKMTTLRYEYAPLVCTHLHAILEDFNSIDNLEKAYKILADEQFKTYQEKRTKRKVCLIEYVVDQDLTAFSQYINKNAYNKNMFS